MSDAKLWAADPHQFGPGKVHALDGSRPGQTYCGKVTSAFPGKPVASGNVTCKVCGDAPARRARAEESRRQWEEQEQQRLLEKEHQDAAWWANYDAYLRTPEWRERSALVIQRAGGICEGCGKNRATQAHHLTYENVGAEFLWQLRAVCKGCHDRFHASARSVRG